MIKLEPFTRDDFARLMDWAVSPEFLVQWAGTQFTYPMTEEQLERYYQSAQTAEPKRLIFKGVDEKGNAVGHIELNQIDHHHRSASISRVLVAPEARGKGYGQQMVREVIRIGFEDLNLHRISLNVFDFNKSAIACYEKVGFVREGLLRELRKVGDRYWNLVVMSMLEEEYRKRYLLCG